VLLVSDAAQSIKYATRLELAVLWRLSDDAQVLLDGPLPETPGSGVHHEVGPWDPWQRVATKKNPVIFYLQRWPGPCIPYCMAQQDNNSRQGKPSALSRPRTSKSTPPPSKIANKTPSTPPPSKVAKPARPSLSFHSTYEDEATRVYLGRSNELAALEPSDDGDTVATTAPPVQADLGYLPKRQPTIPHAENPFTRPRLPTMPTQNTDSCAPVAFPPSNSTGSLPAVGASDKKKIALIVGSAVTAFAAAALFLLLPGLKPQQRGAGAQTHVEPRPVAPLAPIAQPVAPATPVAAVDTLAMAPAAILPESAPEFPRNQQPVARATSHHVARAAAPVARAEAPVARAEAPAPKPEPVKVEPKAVEPKPEKRPPQLPVAGADEDDKPSKNSSKAEKEAMARAKAAAAAAADVSKDQL
jgi:hypothetical protein